MVVTKNGRLGVRFFIPRYYVSDAHDTELKLCSHVLMANYLGTKLSRLVKEHSYLSGTIEHAPKTIERLRRDLETLEASYATALSRLSEVKQVIDELSAIDTEDIRPTRALKRQELGRHGQFRRELVRVLKEARGPISMIEMIDELSNVFNIPLNTSIDKKRAYNRLRSPLAYFKDKGAVERLPCRPGSMDGVWRWIGCYQDGEA